MSLLWTALIVGALVGASAISCTLYIAAADVAISSAISGSSTGAPIRPSRGRR